MFKCVWKSLGLAASLALLATPALAQPVEDPAGAPPAAAPAAAPATAPAAGGPTSGTYVGVMVGPAIPIRPSGGDATFWFGAEFGFGHWNIPVIFNPRSGLFSIETTPRFMWDFELMPNLYATPFGGLEFGIGFGDGGTLLQIGFVIGGRLTYNLTPQLALYAEPLVLDYPLFTAVFPKVGDSQTDFDFNIAYRAMFGATYRF